MDPRKREQQAIFDDLAEADAIGFFGVDRQLLASQGLDLYRELKDVANHEQVARLGLRESKPWLDVGCNVGELLLRVRSSYGVEGVGVDLSRVALGRARRHLSRCLVADAESLPFDDGTFGAVVSLDVMEHVPHPDRFVSEIARVLRPGGKTLLYAISSHNEYTWHPFLRAFTGGRPGQDCSGGHDPERFIAPEDCRVWAAEASLREIDPVPYHAFFSLAFDEYVSRAFSYFYKRVLRPRAGPAPKGFPGRYIRGVRALMRAPHRPMKLADLPWTSMLRGNGFYFLAERTR